MTYPSFAHEGSCLLCDIYGPVSTFSLCKKCDDNEKVELSHEGHIDPEAKSRVQSQLWAFRARLKGDEYRTRQGAASMPSVWDAEDGA
jgi:hypothetical protein